MAEDPIPKDKWYSASGLMVYLTPLVGKVHEEPTIYFGPESSLQERYDDEEVQGGKIALIAFKQMGVQKPPNGLDRMQSTFSKQVAYNQRILAAESEIAGYNCDIPHFLEDMTLEEPVYVCINSSQEMRDEQAIAGQLWIQTRFRKEWQTRATPHCSPPQRKQYPGITPPNQTDQGRAKGSSSSRRNWFSWKSS
jgi:hypothetical protein